MNNTLVGDTNVDFSQRAVVDTNKESWLVSPHGGVARKPLDRIGGEMATRSTTVVRYEPGASFHSHDHPAGEEILVLEGVFSDEHGDYPAGTYLLNPQGFHHAPFSKQGCIIFVKLCQYQGKGRDHITINTKTAPWRAGGERGVEVMPLYIDADYPEEIELQRLKAGANLPRRAYPAGAEIFVLEGTLEDEQSSYPAGAWLRLPAGSSHALRSQNGCMFYIKRGHLAEAK